MCPSGCHVLHLAHGDTRCPTLSIQVPCTAPHPSRIHEHHCSRGTTYSTVHPCSRGIMCPTLSTQAPHPPLLHQSTERYQSEALQVSLCLRHVGWGGPQPAHQAQAHPCASGDSPAVRSAGALGKQSPNPWPQMAASHLHQCNGLKPGGSERCHCFSACSDHVRSTLVCRHYLLLTPA